MAHFHHKKAKESLIYELDGVNGMIVCETRKVVQYYEDILAFIILKSEQKPTNENSHSVYGTPFSAQIGLILPFSRSITNRKRYPTMFI